MYSPQNASVVRILDHSFIKRLSGEVIQTEVSPDNLYIALLTTAGDLLISNFKEAANSSCLNGVKGYIWQDKSSSQNDCHELANIAIINTKNELLIYSISKDLELVSLIVARLSSLGPAFSSFDIGYEITTKVTVLAFPRKDLVNVILDDRTFATVQCHGDEDISVICNCRFPNVHLKKDFFQLRMHSNTIFALADDKSVIYGLSTITATQTHQMSIDSSHIENDINIFEITNDLKTVFLCDSSHKIHILPTYDCLGAPKSPQEPHRIITRLNPLKPIQSRPSSAAKSQNTLNLYFNDLPVKAMHMTLEIIIICQCDDDHELICYYDLKTFKLRSSYRFERNSVLISGLHKVHPPIILTQTGVFMLPSEKLDDNTINKVMIYGNVVAAETLAQLNNLEYIKMPMNVLHLGLNFRQLDTISFFLKSREEVIIKQLNLSIESKEHVRQTSEEDIARIINTECHNNDIVMQLLVNNIKGRINEGKSRQFAEKLLQLAVQYVTRMIAHSSVKNEEQKASTLYSELASIVCNQAMSQLKELRQYQQQSSLAYEQIHNSRESLLKAGKNPSNTSLTSLDNLFPECENMSHEEILEYALIEGLIPTLQAFLSQHMPSDQDLDMHEFVLYKGNQIVINFLKKENMSVARCILSNMGVQVNKKLKEICFETYDTKLRNFIETELRHLDQFSDKEIEVLNYVHKLKEIYPCQEFSSISVPAGSEISLFHKLVNNQCNETSENTSNGEYLNISVDLVLNMSERTRSMLYIDSIMNSSTEKMSLLKEVDGLTYWEYLIIHNNHDKLLNWISTFCSDADADDEVFPYGHEITLDMIDLLPQSGSIAIKDIILDELARYGLFCMVERQNFVLMLTRISKFGGLQKVNEIFRKKTSVLPVLEFHKSMINYCLDQELVNFLWTYLEFYNLNADLVIEMESEKQSMPKWSMIFPSFYSWNKEPLDMSRIIQASLSNLRFLMDGNSHLEFNKDDHHLFIPLLSTFMLMPDQLNKIINNEDFSNVISISASNFKLASSYYPYLHGYLFKDSSDGRKSISLYKLMEDSCILNTKQLFGWQESNDVKSRDCFAEFPHFSHPFLMGKFGHTEELTVSYYLKSGRPCFAFSKFLSQNINVTGSVSKRRIEGVCDLAHRLAFENYLSQLITSACVAFIEMLGHNSLTLRVTLEAAHTVLHWKKALNMFNNEKQQEMDEHDLKEILRDIHNSRLVLLEYLEESIVYDLDCHNASRSSIDALRKWNIVVMFCAVHKLKKSTVFLRHCAEDNNWLMFLTFSQIHQYPKDLVTTMINHFRSSHLREHLRNTLRHIQTHRRSVQVHSPDTRNVRDKLYDKIGLTSVPTNIASQQSAIPKIQESTESVTESIDTQTVTNLSSTSSEIVVTSTNEEPTDFISVILKCQRESCSWKELLNYAITMKNPGYCVIAATYLDASLFDCLCSWLYVSHYSIQDLNFEYTSSTWEYSQFKELLKNYVRNRRISTLYLGLKIFYPKSPLYYLVSVFKMTLLDNQLSVAGTVMKNYQFAMVELEMASYEIMNSRRLMEEITVDLINEALMSCSTAVMQFVLVSSFSSANFILLFTEMDLPNYQLLKDILLCLTDTEIIIDISSLLSNKLEVFEVAVGGVVTQLLDQELHDKAQLLCSLLNLPLDVVVINRIEKKLKALSSSENWIESEFRIQFWRDSYSSFIDKKINLSSMLNFFKENLEKSACPYECYHMLRIMIQCFEPSHQKSYECEQLEAQMWYNKVIAEIETPYLDGLKNYELGPVSDFMCTEFSSLKSVYDFEDPQYFLAIERVIGHELTYGRIKQALLISNIFNYRSQDLEIVLACIRLAKGEIEPESLPADIKALISGSHKPKITRKISISSLTRKRSTSSSSPHSSDSDVTTRSTPDPVILPSHAEVTDIICKLKAACVDAKQCCDRILTYYEVSMALQVSYGTIVIEIQHDNDIYSLLSKLLVTNCDDKYILVKELISSHKLDSESLNNFLYVEILKCLHSYCGTGDGGDVLRSSSELIFNPSDNVGSFLQIINLTSGPCMLGRMLLNEIDVYDYETVVHESKCMYR